MTKKDYELIANWLLVTKPQDEDSNEFGMYRHTVGYLAAGLELNNSKFNKQKFLAACGIKIK